MKPRAAAPAALDDGADGAGGTEVAGGEHTGHGVDAVADGGELHPAAGGLAPVEGAQGAEAEGQVPRPEAADGGPGRRLAGAVAEPPPSGSTRRQEQHRTHHDSEGGQDAHDLSMIHGQGSTPSGPGRVLPRGAGPGAAGRGPEVAEREVIPAMVMRLSAAVLAGLGTRSSVG